MKILKVLGFLIVLIYAADSFSSNIVFEGPIDYQASTRVLTKLIKLNNNTPLTEDINIIIDSWGGRIDYGFVILTQIEKMQKKGRKVNIIVMNYCASMCFTILQQADRRYMSIGATLMQHMPHIGDGKEHTEQPFGLYLELLILKQQMMDIELKRITISDDEWFKLTNTMKGYYLNSKEAMKINAIDGIISIYPPNSALEHPVKFTLSDY